MIFVFPPSPPNEPPCTVSKKKITPKRTPVRGRTTTRPRAWQFVTRNTNTDRCNTTSPVHGAFFFARAGKNRQVHRNEPPCTVLFVFFFRQVHQNEPPCVVSCSCRVVSCRVVSKRAPVYGAFCFCFFLPSPPKRAPVCRVMFVSCRVVHGVSKRAPVYGAFCFFRQVHQNEPPCVVSCSCSCRVVFVSCRVVSCSCRVVHGVSKRAPVYGDFVFFSAKSTKTSPRVSCRVRVVSCRVVSCQNEPPCTVLLFFPPSPPKRAPVCRVVSCRVVSCTVCRNEPVYGDFVFVFFFLPSPPKRAPVSCRVVSCRVVSCRVVHGGAFFFFFCPPLWCAGKTTKSIKTSPRVSCRVVSCRVVSCQNEPPCTVLFVFSCETRKNTKSNRTSPRVIPTTTTTTKKSCRVVSCSCRVRVRVVSCRVRVVS